MDEKVQQTTTVSRDAMGNTATQTVRTSNNLFSSDFFISKTNQVIFTIFGIINLLILIRFGLFLFGANRVGVVNFIISLTNIFVLPFQGIFPNPEVIEGSYFEVSSIVAIIAWFTFAGIVAVVIGLFSTKTDEPV